jgi:hypothetical protein
MRAVFKLAPAKVQYPKACAVVGGTVLTLASNTLAESTQPDKLPLPIATDATPTSQ